MADLKELIEQELDQYLEWPTADKSHVTTVSAKLFAEHMARLYADHIAQDRKMVSNHIPDTSKKVGRPQIREAFLRNGAKIEPDRDDLPDWVYESVFELLDSVIQQAAPAIQYVAPAIQQAGLAVQGEPVAWMVTSIRPDFDKPIKALHSVQMLADEQQRHWEGRGCLVYQTPLYTAPQPAEQQPSAGDSLTSVPDEVFAAEFAAWWDEHGQFCRAGGGTYERSFAFEAWRHLYPQLMNLQMAAAEHQQPAPDVAGLVEALEARRDDLRWMGLRHNYHNQTVEDADAFLTAPDVSQLVEALERCITSMLDSGYRANAVVIQAARAALAAHRKGGES